MVRRGAETREERAARRAAERAATSAELERVRLAIAQAAETRAAGGGSRAGQAAGASREKQRTRDEAFQDLLSRWITFRVSRRQLHAIRCLEARRPKFKMTRFLRRVLLKKLESEALLTPDQVEAPPVREKRPDGFRQRGLFGANDAEEIDGA
jgi:hypothetical protein